MQNKIIPILKKDLLIELSYKFRFIYSISFIFAQLLIFYFLSSFLESSYSKNPDSAILDLYGYFIIGICILDISYTLISYASTKIEEYKKTGIFEELFVLPISPAQLILFSNIYPAVFCIFKICVYSIFINYFIPFIEINSSMKLLLIYVIIFGIITFIGISLIACSFSILFFRGSPVAMLHNTLSILFGGVLYPVNFISENLTFFHYLLPAHSLTDLVRFSLGIYDLPMQQLLENIIIVASHSILLLSIGYISLYYAFKKSFKDGKISLY